MGAPGLLAGLSIAGHQEGGRWAIRFLHGPALPRGGGHMFKPYAGR